MKLTTATLLEGVAEALRDQVSPRLDDAFAKEAARMAQSLITIAARADDDAAAIRIEENARIRRILGAGVNVVARPELAMRFGLEAMSSDPGYRISELDTENGRLKALLIELHGAIEAQEGEAARDLDRAIWRMMRDFEEARRPRA
ncbi:MAG: hypothetical protein KDE55_04265 [Novosphingobium sp.]|nr:hypothetical protein [Novosphingobium sp.]